MVLVEPGKSRRSLVADIVGYSRLAGANEDRTLSRPRGLRSDLIDPAIDAHQSCDVSARTNRKTEDQREECMRLNRRFVNVGLAASLVAPAFSRIARAGGDTVKIGMVLSVTGPGATAASTRSRA